MAKVALITSKVNQLAAIARPQLEIVWKYSKVELRPPTFRELPEVGYSFKKIISSATSGGYKNLTIKDAWLNTLVGAEIIFWFSAGECIGKRSIIGYNIPGAANWDIHF